MTAFDYDFQIYTPRSRTLVEFVEAGDKAALRDEIDRTVAAVAGDARAKVEKGTMTPAEATSAERLFAAIAADLEAEQTYFAGKRMHPLPTHLAELAALRGFTWSDKVEALRAEILDRRRTWPARVEKGTMAPADARSQLERLEAVHAHYWLGGFAWDGGPHAGPCGAGSGRDSIEQLRAHIDALHAARTTELAA